MSGPAPLKSAGADPVGSPVPAPGGAELGCTTRRLYDRPGHRQARARPPRVNGFLSFPNSCLGTPSAKLRFAGRTKKGRALPWRTPNGCRSRNGVSRRCVPKQEFGNEGPSILDPRSSILDLQYSILEIPASADDDPRLPVDVGFGAADELAHQPGDVALAEQEEADVGGHRALVRPAEVDLRRLA